MQKGWQNPSLGETVKNHCSLKATLKRDRFPEDTFIFMLRCEQHLFVYAQYLFRPAFLNKPMQNTLVNISLRLSNYNNLSALNQALKLSHHSFFSQFVRRQYPCRLSWRNSHVCHTSINQVEGWWTRSRCTEKEKNNYNLTQAQK